MKKSRMLSPLSSFFHKFFIFSLISTTALSVQEYSVNVGSGCLRIRSGGSYNAKIKGCLPNNSAVIIISPAGESGYAKIRTGDGKIGYMYEKFLKPSAGGNEPTPAPVVTRPPVKPPTAVPPTVAPPKVEPDGETAPTETAGGNNDCEIPPGPVAYNIGSTAGAGEQCNARSVVIQYKGVFPVSKFGKDKKKFGIGYINPLVESSEIGKYGADSKKCFRNTNGSRYCEGKFSDYSSPKAVRYLTDQIKHWKEQGKAIGQSCVPVDIDNCDGIGTANYQKVLDLVGRLNKQDPKTKIKVFVKNAHMPECRKFLNHPESVGAFIEEISSREVDALIRLRTDPKKILLFAEGSERGASSESLQSISRRKIPNSSVSIGDGDYTSVKQCDYTGLKETGAVPGTRIASVKRGAK